MRYINSINQVFLSLFAEENNKQTGKKWVSIPIIIIIIIYLLSSILSNHYYDTVLQAFLNFRGFDFRDFLFSTVHNSILFSSPLVLVSNLDLCGFCSAAFILCPHINSVNPGMPVHRQSKFWGKKHIDFLSNSKKTQWILGYNSNNFLILSSIFIYCFY